MAPSLEPPMVPALREPPAPPIRDPGPLSPGRRKQLNVGFLGRLLAVLVLLATGVHLLHGYQVRRNVGALLRRADQTEQAGDLGRAADYLGRYLALTPGDADTQARYGLLLADPRLAQSPKAILRAFLVIESALRREPHRHDLRRRAAQLALDLRRFTDAREHLEYLLRESPDDGTLEELLGRCHEADRRYALARAYYEASIRHAPSAVASYGRLAYLLRRQPGEARQKHETREEVLARADQHMEAMVSANPDAYQVYLLRAQYRRDFSADAEAASVLDLVERDIRRAQELAPDAVEVLLTAAELAQDRAAAASRDGPDAPAARVQCQAARAFLQRACRLHPEEWRLYQALAALEIQEGQWAAALQWLRQGLNRQPTQIDLLWNQAELLIQQGSRDEADAAIARLSAETLPPGALDYLTGSIQLRQERWGEAAAHLERAYPLLLGLPESRQDGVTGELAQQAGLLLGRCYEQLGDVERANAIYARLVTQEPRSLPARLGLAATHASMDRLAEALSQYQQVLRSPAAPAAVWLEVARLRILRNLAGDRPDWTAVDQALAEADRLQPRPVQATLVRAEAAIGQQQYEQARAVLIDGNDRQSWPVEIWVALAELEDRQGKAAGAQTVLREAERLRGDCLKLRLAWARYWSRHPGREARAGLALLARDLGKLTATDQERLLRELAYAHRRLSAPGEAERLWEQLAEIRPNLLDVRIILFNSALQKGDESAQERLVQDMQRIEGPEGALWRYAKVCRLIGRMPVGQPRRLQEARQLQVAAARRRGLLWQELPADASAEDVFGKAAAALTQYRKSMELRHREPAALSGTLELLYQSWRQPTAPLLHRKRSLEAFLKGPPGASNDEVGPRNPGQPASGSWPSSRGNGEGYQLGQTADGPGAPAPVSVANRDLALATLTSLGLAFFLGLQARTFWQGALLFVLWILMIPVFLLILSYFGLLALAITAAASFLLMSRVWG